MDRGFQHAINYIATSMHLFPASGLKPTYLIGPKSMALVKKNWLHKKSK